MDLFFIALVLPMVVMPIIAFLIIRPSEKFHCIVMGCGQSFDTLNNLVEHLRNEHDFSNAMIGEILDEIHYRR